ncbi:zinc finger, CCHC-type containing protein [Tanacetum coccineum]
MNVDPLIDIYQKCLNLEKKLWEFIWKAKYMAEDASSKKFLVSNFTNCKMTDSRQLWNNTMNFLEELNLVELGSHLRIEESLKVQDSNKPKGNNVDGPLVVNMIENNNSTRYNDNKGKRKHHDNTRADFSKKAKPTCWKCGKTGHNKRDCKGVNVGNKANGSAQRVQWMDDDVAWWVDLRATVHVCKDRCWFKTYKSLNDGSILHIGNESTALVHRCGCVDLRLSSRKVVSLFNVLHVPNIRKNLVSNSVLNNCGYKQVTESSKFVLSKHGVFIGLGYLSNNMSMLNIVNDNIGPAFMSTSKVNDSILWHTRLGHIHFKRMKDMSNDGLIPAFDMDTKNDLCDLHATPSLGNKKHFVTFIDYASRFCYVYLLHPKDEALDKFKSVGIIHEMTALYTLQQNVISERKNRVLKEMVNSMLYYPGLSQAFWGEAMAVVRLLDPKLKTLGERGIECIFVGYVETSKAFSSDDDPKTFDEAMKSKDVAFWKETINDEMDSIMGNNTWVLADLSPGCKPLGYKWIFKRKLKVDGTIGKFKARLAIQLFRQNKFDETGKGVIIFIYVDDMLIFGIDQVQVDLTKKFFSLRFSMKDMREADVILVSTHMDTSEKLMLNNGQAVSQLEYSKCWKVTLMQVGSATLKIILLPVAGYSFLVEVQFLRLPRNKLASLVQQWNLNLWLYAATLAKAYSQIYNGKVRHLGVRHSMIHELITNGVVSIEFVKSQQNLADNLMKGLARDLL